MNMTEMSSRSDSVNVTLTSTGPSCNFSLMTDDQSTDCELIGPSFTCHLTGLQPGTLYHLTVMSKTDGEKSNASVRTGEKILRRSCETQKILGITNYSLC